MTEQPDTQNRIHKFNKFRLRRVPEGFPCASSIFRCFEILTDMNLTASKHLQFNCPIKLQLQGSGIFLHGTTPNPCFSTSSLTSEYDSEQGSDCKFCSQIQFSVTSKVVAKINGLYSHDSNISIQAIADHGYEFSNWSQF